MAQDQPAGGRGLQNPYNPLSMEENQASRQRWLIFGGMVLFLLCLGVVSGVWLINLFNQQAASGQSTQEAISMVRTQTAQVVITQSARATRIAIPTQQFEATQTQFAESIQATRSAETPSMLLKQSKDWAITLEDDFSIEANGWYTGTDDDDLAKGTWKIEGGQYRIALTAKDVFSQWMWPTLSDSLTDEFYFSGRLNFLKTYEDMDGGLIFRLQEDGSFYLFDLYPNGNFAVYRHDPGSWEVLLDEQNTVLFNPGTTNQLEVVGENSFYGLFLNGNFLASFEDSLLSGGGVGLLVGLPEVGAEGEWIFDDIIVKLP